MLPLSPLWPSGAFGLLVKPWGAPGWPLNLLQPLCTSRLPITSQFWGTSRLPIPSWPHQTPRPVVPLCSLLGHEGSLASTSVMACPPTPIEFPPATVHLQISHHTPVVGLWLHFAPWLWGACRLTCYIPVVKHLRASSHPIPVGSCLQVSPHTSFMGIPMLSSPSCGAVGPLIPPCSPHTPFVGYPYASPHIPVVGHLPAPFTPHL